MRFVGRNFFVGLLSILAFVMSGCGKMGGSPGRICCRVETEETKGNVITTEGLKHAPWGEFCLDAYNDAEYIDHADGGTTPHPAGQYIDCGGSANVRYGESWDLTADYYWLNGINIRFWCWAPVNVNGVRELNHELRDLTGANEMKFRYTMPAGGHVTDGHPDDATRQDDLIMAYEYKIWTESSDEFINIHFYHALSQINFIIDLSDGSFADALDVQSISLKGVASKAICTFSGNLRSFLWEVPISVGNFTQYYTKDMIGYREESDPLYDEAVNSLSVKRSSEMPFMAIPQVHDGTASIEVVFSFRDDQDNLITRERSVTLDDTWVAGKYYTYRLKAQSVLEPYQFDFTVDLWESGGREFMTPSIIG